MPQRQEGAIRGLLIPLDDATLLVPGAVVAEVIAYDQPVPMSNDQEGPPWLLGAIAWRGLRLPVISVEALRGGVAVEAGASARLIVLKALSGQLKMPYFAALAQQIPRLVSVSRGSIEPWEADEEGDADGYRYVLANGEPAGIPDLEAMERQVYAAIHT